MAQFMVDAFNTVSCKFFWTKVQKRVSNALARWWLISFNTWRSWRESHALVTATMSSARNGIWLARSWTRCSTSLVPPMSIWARGRTWRWSSLWTCVVPSSPSPLRRRTAWWRGRTSPSCSSSRGMTTSWRYRCHSIASLWILSRIWLRASGERGEETSLYGGNHEEDGCPEGLVWVGVVDGEGIWSMNVACHLIALKHS